MKHLGYSVTSAAYDKQKVTLMIRMDCGARFMRQGIAQKSVCTEVVKARRYAQLKNVSRAEHAAAMDEYDARGNSFLMIRILYLRIICPEVATT